MSTDEFVVLTICTWEGNAFRITLLLWIVRIISPRPKVNGGLTTLPLTLGHGWVITLQCYADVTTYPWPKLYSSLVNLRYWNRHRVTWQIIFITMDYLRRHLRFYIPIMHFILPSNIFMTNNNIKTIQVPIILYGYKEFPKLCLNAQINFVFRNETPLGWHSGSSPEIVWIIHARFK